MHDATELLLLLPKIRPPRSVSKLVLRPRLAQHIKAIEDARLTIISAPSGFGKSTVGATWARDLKSRPSAVAWLSLDKDDNDASRFFQYLVFSIGHALKEHSLKPGQNSRPAHSPLKGEQLITSLINDIVEDGSEFFLFLDDFQAVTDESVRKSIQFLIRNAPSNFHAVILSHPHGVAGIPKGKPGTELYLHASDLRFTEEETRELFDAYSRQDHQAILAHSMTGGWIAALHIMAASNIGASDHSFDGKIHLLNEDYLGNLLNLVMSGLTADEVSLVQMTCITGRMCGPLFTVLAGISQPRNIIQSVENTHCLISRMSEDGYWFTCHDLVRESIISQLSVSNPELITDVGNRASGWYAKQGYWSEAVAQALAVGNRELAFQIIESCAIKLLYKGDLLTLIGWERQLELSSRPTTSVKTLTVLALTIIMAADYEEQENLHSLLDLIDKRMRCELPPEAMESVYWHLQGIRAILACRHDDLPSALQLSLECLERPVIFPSLTQSVRCAAGYAYLQARQWDDFYRILTAVSPVPDDEFTFLSGIYRQILLGLASIIQLNFARSIRYLEAANQTTQKALGPGSLPGALASGLLAYIYCERLELDRAENCLNGAMDLIGQSGYIDCVCKAYMAAIRIAMLRRENEYALTLLEKWEATVSSPFGARPQLICTYEKMCFFLNEKSFVRAKASLVLIQKLIDSAASSSIAVSAEWNTYASLAHGQFALATGSIPEAKNHLESTYKAAVSNDDPYALLLSTIALALAEFKAGSNDDACKYLAEALTLAQETDLKASILCQPGEIWPMLEMYKKHALKQPGSIKHHSYIDALKEACSRNFNSIAVSLSPREESVLRLIAQDKSNKEISIALNITPETVKTHLKSIFIKLNVTKRNAAVRRANAIKLL